MALIYLASSWRNEQQPEAVRLLRAAGHSVYDFRNPEPGNAGFSWRKIAAKLIPHASGEHNTRTVAKLRRDGAVAFIESDGEDDAGDDDGADDDGAEQDGAEGGSDVSARPVRWLLALASALGYPVSLTEPEPEPDDHQDDDDPAPPTALPDADRARLDAAARKRARKGAARRAQALRCGALLAALLGCAPLDGEAPDAPPACEAGASRPCAGCRAGALRTNLPGASTCEPERDGGPLAWGPCRCGGSTP